MGYNSVSDSTGVSLFVFA